MNISNIEKQQLIQELAELKQVHRDLDIAIEEMVEKVEANQLDISRLKKKKLKLKDSIIRLESKLIPDLHAWGAFCLIPTHSYINRSLIQLFS